MTSRLILPIALILWPLPTLMAQESNSAGRQQAATDEGSPSSTGKKPKMMSLTPKLPDYKGDFWSRSYLTGDWGGARTKLAEDGITFKLDVVQNLQGNARGGADTMSAFRYSGAALYSITFDTARMGLWPAGQLLLKGETQFGQSINGKVGSLLAANATGLFPLPDDSGVTTLTDVVYTQFLSEKFGFALGKIDFRGGDQNVFAHDEATQFMNLAFLANPIVLSYAPYTSLTGGIFFKPTDWLVVSFTALDSFGRPDTPGFDTAFHSPQGTTFINEWDFTIKPFGKPGHQRFGVVYSNKDFRLLDQDLRLGGPFKLLSFIRQFGLDADTKPDDWAIYYNFDQYVYTEAEDPTQGIGVFGRFGWSSGEANPFKTFYSIGIGGKGVIPSRDHDTFGLGYYYAHMSYDLPALLSIGDEQGVELYYNFEVTPWLHITPDLQYIIDPGGGADDDALVYGIRTVMSF